MNLQNDRCELVHQNFEVLVSQIVVQDVGQDVCVYISKEEPVCIETV